MIYHDPAGIGGAQAVKSIEQVEKVEDAVGPRLWEFFGRDPQYVVEVLALSKLDMRSIGPIMTDMCFEAVEACVEMAPRVMRPLLKMFMEVLGKDFPKLLGRPEFVKVFFRPIVVAFKEMDFKDERDEAVNATVSRAARLKVRANKDKILAWKAAHGF